MTLLKTAQEKLFKELEMADINPIQQPEYNGYTIDRFGFFENHLNSLFEEFEKELNDNLTNRDPSLELYLTDILKTITAMFNKVHEYQKDEIYDILQNNPESFKLNKLGYINHFFNFQLDIIRKTHTQIQSKLELVKNPELFKPVSSSVDESDNSSIPKNKIQFKLSKIHLTALFWWLTESGFLEFESHDGFVKFMQENFQYYDESNNIFVDMKRIGSLMSKFNSEYSREADPEKAREHLMGILQKTTLPPPPKLSKLKKQKWSR